MFNQLFATYTCIPYKSMDKTSLINSRKKDIIINCRRQKGS